MKTYSPNYIWNVFKTNFPSMAKDIKQFKSHGENAITLWFIDKKPMVFTILSNKSWKLEPYKL